MKLRALAKRNNTIINSAPVEPPAYGDSNLTLDKYWASPEASAAWGVLEINTGVAEDAYYATSVFWGLPSREKAEIVAAFANTVHRAYDRLRHRQRQLVAYCRPPCTVTVAIDGGRALHLAVTSEFPVCHQPSRWVEIATLANERHLIDVPKDRAALDKLFLAYASRTFFGPLSLTLPAAMFDARASGCFVQPEGLEMRELTAGDKADAKLNASGTVRRRRPALTSPVSDDEEDEEDDDEDDEDDDEEEVEDINAMDEDDSDDADDADDDDDDESIVERPVKKRASKDIVMKDAADDDGVDFND